jgi:hypothetical protein
MDLSYPVHKCADPSGGEPERISDDRSEPGRRTGHRRRRWRPQTGAERLAEAEGTRKRVRCSPVAAAERE